MATLSPDMKRRFERLAQDLEREFPDVPADAIEADLQNRIWSLSGKARFNDFVPLLAHKAVRERLRTAA